MTNESNKRKPSYAKVLARKRLSTEPYKGVRDFYPADQAIQNYIFNKWRKTVESFGYVEYGASLLEPTELYEAKSGEELIKEQTYSFKDRGDRDVTLRPEMTPTIARMIAGKSRELSFPIRWYTIANAFRYERPQRGRVREHWQLNADLFGVEKVEADAEIIILASQILKDIGAKEGDFEIKINYAGMLSEFLTNEFNIDEEKTNRVIKAIDKYGSGKTPKADFNKIIDKIAGEENRIKLVALLKDDAEVNKKLNKNKKMQVLISLDKKLKELGINATFDPFLTRGFDYYTGIIFEVYDTHPENNRAIFGGGRYDNLLEIFNVEKVPAIGFGIGDVPIQNFLEVRNLIPEYISSTDLMLCVLKDENMQYSQDLAKKLRTEGLNVAVNLSNKKVGDQIKLADKQSIPFIICIGDEEEKTGKFKIKELKTGEEKELNENEIIKIIRK